MTTASPFCRRGHDRRITGSYGPIERAGSKCAQCQRDRATAKRVERREILAAYKLGKGCSRCGYNEHPLALQLHHVNAADKRFTVSKMTESMSDEVWWAEIRKCVVLCANCHFITHGDE